LPGSLKIAILIQSLGNEASRAVLNRFNDREKTLIQNHMNQLGAVSPALVEKVAKDFAEMVTLRKAKPERSPANSGAKKEEANPAHEASAESSMAALQSLDPDVLVELISNEHPQTIAIILVHIKPETASEVLVKLPAEIQADVAARVAGLDKVVSGIVEEIGRAFEDILKVKKGSETHRTGGVDCLAEILNQAEGMATQSILDELEETNPELAAAVKQKMFVFEDLVLVDDKDLQKLLRAVETKELATALKAATDEVKQKIFRNMSDRASEMLQEEIESLGAVRMSEVETAQQAITKIIQDMEAKGEIVITGRKGDELIG